MFDICFANFIFYYLSHSWVSITWQKPWIKSLQMVVKHWRPCANNLNVFYSIINISNTAETENDVYWNPGSAIHFICTLHKYILNPLALLYQWVMDIVWRGRGALVFILKTGIPSQCLTRNIKVLNCFKNTVFNYFLDLDISSHNCC